MPLPADTEAAANRIAARVSRFDRDLDRYILDGGRPPSVAEVMRDLRDDLAVAVAVAVADGASVAPPPGVVRDAVRTQQNELQTALADAERRARRVRRDIPRRLPEQDDDETQAAFIARVGAVTAAVALAKRLRRPLRDIARQTGTATRLPRPTAGYSKMVVRTESAIARNRFAADVAEAGGSFEPGQPVTPGLWAVYIQDARKGPTDEACERVNGQWATPDWLRNHPVEHPNCTRRGRARKLPAGAIVTLLE